MVRISTRRVSEENRVGGTPAHIPSRTFRGGIGDGAGTNAHGSQSRGTNVCRCTIIMHAAMGKTGLDSAAGPR